MAEVTQDVDPAEPSRDASATGRPRPVSAPPGGPPVIDNPAAAALALRDYFLANADRGDHAANDELVAELVRRIRVHQASYDGRR